MPADFELMPSTRTVYTRGWGTLSDTDLLNHMARISALFKDGVLDAEWAQICDFTGVDNLNDVTSEGIRRAAEGNPWPRYTVRAFIVSTRRTIRAGPDVPGARRSEDRRSVHHAMRRRCRRLHRPGTRAPGHRHLTHRRAAGGWRQGNAEWSWRPRPTWHRAADHARICPSSLTLSCGWHLAPRLLLVRP